MVSQECVYVRLQVHDRQQFVADEVARFFGVTSFVVRQARNDRKIKRSRKIFSTVA